MTSPELPKTVAAFGREIGQAMGWPPVAGQVLATLMLTDGALSLQELGARLGASAGSISQVTRLLSFSGVIRRVKMPGGRQVGYEYRQDAWIGCLQHEVSVDRSLLELADATVKDEESLPDFARERMVDMSRYYGLLVDTLDAAMPRLHALLASTESTEAAAAD